MALGFLQTSCWTWQPYEGKGQLYNLQAGFREPLVKAFSVSAPSVWNSLSFNCCLAKITRSFRTVRHCIQWTLWWVSATISLQFTCNISVLQQKIWLGYTWSKTDNQATPSFGHSPITVSLPVWAHCTNARRNKCQEDLSNNFPLQKTGRNHWDVLA